MELKRVLGIAVTLAVTTGLATAAQAESYSGPGFSGEAHMAESGKATEKVGSVNVGAGGFRMDIQADGQHVVSLLRWNSETVYALMPEQKMYMEIPPEQSGWSPYEDRPCSGYQDGKKLADETVNGRATEKWRCTGPLNSPAGKPPSDATVWYDPEVQFEIKVVEDTGEIFEIRNIKVGGQDAALFDVPAGYSRFDMNAMMQQMMQQQQQQ